MGDGAGESWITPGGVSGGEARSGRGGTVPSQPWLPVSPPPSPAGGAGRVALGLVVSVVLSVAAVVVAFALPDEYDGEPLVAPPSQGEGEAHLEELDDLVRFRAPDNSYELLVPDTWVAISLEGDLAGLGRETFPDDPARADAVDQIAASVPRAVVFASIHRDAMGGGRFASNFNISRMPDLIGGDLDRMAVEARASIRAQVGEVTDERRFTTAAGEAVRIEAEFRGMPGITGIQYSVPVDGSIWSLTFTSDGLPAAEPLADAVAETFEPHFVP